MKRKFFVLLSPDEISSTEVPAPVPTGETPAPVPTIEAPGPPPAARLVVEGVKSEREIELERMIENTNGKLADAEITILERERQNMELERENQELKKIPVAQPVKKVKRKPLLPTMFDEE